VVAGHDEVAGTAGRQAAGKQCRVAWIRRIAEVDAVRGILNDDQVVLDLAVEAFTLMKAETPGIRAVVKVTPSSSSFGGGYTTSLSSPRALPLGCPSGSPSIAPPIRYCTPVGS
jgi:hypothetical protein